ncbi:MAG: hypothetical protein ACI857_001178 [Arenicella sp.]|jgi:hypothetical protein
MFRAIVFFPVCLLIFTLGSCIKEYQEVPDELLDYTSSDVDYTFDEYTLQIDSLVITQLEFILPEDISATAEIKLLKDTLINNSVATEITYHEIFEIDSLIDDLSATQLPYTVIPPSPIAFSFSNKGSWSRFKMGVLIDEISMAGNHHLITGDYWDTEKLIYLTENGSNYSVFGDQSSVLTLYFRFEK